MDQETLKSLLHYDPETGIITWLPREETCQQLKGWNKKHAWKRAGNIGKDGYEFIIVKRTEYKLHRIAWLYVYGNFPNGPLDHINRDKADNRIRNLRLATTSLNAHNSAISKANKSGVKGVSWFKPRNKWQALIYWQGKSIFLGTYSDIKDAEAAYKAASLKYAKEFSIYATQQQSNL
jgi:hypothetical protein